MVELFLVNFFTVKSWDLLSADKRCFFERIKASLVFCKWLIDLSISEIASLNLSWARDTFLPTAFLNCSSVLSNLLCHSSRVSLNQFVIYILEFP